jgi:prepilin-type N-terminal cleavage/methylation domain-containing protein
MHPNLPLKRRSGFSLMELMVVITIIAILSSIIIPAGHAVQSNMKKVQAQKTATELRTALMSYFTEYKRFPAFPGGGNGTDTTVATDSTTPVMRTLLGVDTTFNRRGVQFFSSRPAKGKGMPGLYRSADGSTVELLDPFLSGSGGSSNPYYIMIDANYDNSLQVPSRTQTGSTEEIFTNVAVWSYGVDGVLGSQGKSSDDITAY